MARVIRPVAIIDIGSNSVRLVVYSGAQRVPTAIFNEKLLAGLGSGIAKTGRMSTGSQETALAALQRFRLLLRHMGVRDVRTVATAAARDAENGPEFVRMVERVGLKVEVIAADEEARLAGEGVLSAIPDADGVVGDLGGGSLELVDVRGGSAGRALSLPLGVLRASAGAEGEKAAARLIERSGFAGAAEGRSFYMVGGSWRALARIDMIHTGHPLPITHQYSLHPDRTAELRRIVVSPDPAIVKATSPARLASTPVAAMLLDRIARLLRPRELVVSSFGIREGLLYSALPSHVRERDPLIEAARDAGGAERRFGEHGDALDRWVGAIFDDPPERARIRLAACLLADAAWQANPLFRAERGIETALHGNWVAVTAAERVLMAQALSSNFGRDKLPGPELATLCGKSDLERARQWGHAIRLAQRLCGGVGPALSGTGLELPDGVVRLAVTQRQAPLVGEAVERRLARLAGSLGRTPEVVVKD